MLVTPILVKAFLNSHVHVLFHRCARVKRERERDRGKHIKMKFQPQKVMVEFTGYKTEELVKAFSSMGVASGITDKPQQKKLPSTHKRYFH